MSKEDQIIERLDRLENNHHKHIADDFNVVKTGLALVKKDMKWVLRIGGFIILQSIVILIKLYL